MAIDWEKINKNETFAHAAVREIQEKLGFKVKENEFAKIFCDAAKNQKSINITLKEVLKDLLVNDNETIEIIKNLQREIAKEDWRNFAKKVGIAGWTILLLLLGAAFQAILRKF